MNRYSWVFLLAGASVAVAAGPDIGQVNGSIVVTAGQSVGDVSTVNGSIHLDDKAIVADAHTVNGGITLGAASAAQSLTTVNGSISIGATSRVAGAVTTVNGAIALQHSADVSGRLINVNGSIHLDAAHVGGGIETVSGNIQIGAHSKVEGGILVRKSCSSGIWSWLPFNHCEPSRIVIGPDSIVQGTLRFEHEVKLYVSTRARIGPVEGAQAVVYSGDAPPL